MIKQDKSALFCLCSLIALCGLAQTCTWNGAASGYWDDGANWSTGTPPQAGDDVLINIWKDSSYNNMNVTITNTTPVLNSLEIGRSYPCTLTMTNWNTCIRAKDITIGTRGILTCACSYDQTDTNDMSRVYISCSNLTIVAGGKIDVDGKGYDMTPKGSTDTGLGPGAGTGVTTSILTHSGASHGGYGGTWRGKGTLPYDNPEAPVYPGSSGGQARWGNQVSGGGGAVRIIATGTVTVNGSILASAENSEKYNAATGSGGNDNTSGSGGSIFIEASVFKGLNGVLRADGGSSACPTNSNTGRVGGGGMIAVHYDTSLQQDGDVSGMTISAAPGIYKMKNWTLPLVSNDLYRSEGGLGTLWFSDAKLLESLGTGISGRIECFADLTLDSLTVTAGHIAFPKQGGTVTVLGDLVVSGSTARVEFGGDFATNHHGSATLWSEVPQHVSVGGNLRVIDGARMDVRSSKTNETAGTVGAFVNVAGSMEITGGGSVFVWSDNLTGASPRFEVGSMQVGEGSRFTADERGYAGYFSMWADSAPAGGRAYGPGAGKNESSSTTLSVSSGGGHGGFGGGRANRSGGKTYDDAFYPALPGSGGTSSTSWAYPAGNGGGVIDVRATGAIVIDGEISADGGKANSVNDRSGIGSGAGGTVFLYGDTVVSSAGSFISAKGGDEYMYSDKCAYVGGGGGRISIWAGAAMSTEGVRARRITRGNDPASFGSPRISLAGTVTAAGGVATKVWSESWDPQGRDGTIWLTSIEPPSGAILIIR